MRSRVSPGLVASLLIPVMTISMTGCFLDDVPVTTTSQPDDATPTSAQLPPVINQFAASPDNISPGEVARLIWSVSDATVVSIDNGIGNVALNGERTVAPSATTIYTLSATGPGGSNTATAQVIVKSSTSPDTDNEVETTQPPSGGSADLPVINSFVANPDEGGNYTLSWSVSNASAVSITPDIGAVDEAGATIVTPPSTTTYVLSAKNAHGVREQSVTITVSGVIGTAHIDWLDEEVAYDFVERASSAEWMAGILGGTFEVRTLSFPGTTSDNQGYVCYQLNTKLNDGTTYDRLLETHPRWVDNGFILGRYSDVNVPSGAKLKVKVGIINGYTSGRVKFNVRMIRGSVYVVWNQIVAYGDGTKTAEIDLSDFAGWDVDFELLVEANGVSTQDWAAWAEAKIIH